MQNPLSRRFLVVHLLGRGRASQVVMMNFKRVRFDLVGLAGMLQETSSMTLGMFVVSGILAFNLTSTNAEHSNQNLPGQFPQVFRIFAILPAVPNNLWPLGPSVVLGRCFMQQHSKSSEPGVWESV